MRTNSIAAAALLLAGTLGGMGYSFDAGPRSIFATPPRAATPPVAVKPLAVQPITDGTDAASRARSWFNAATGEICIGGETNKTCR